MTENWIAFAIGAGSGGLLLALIARLPTKLLCLQGFLAFAIMLWIYVGVRLADGSIEEIALEALFALIAGGIAQFAIMKWPPSVGIAIFFHGVYDAVAGPHTGVAEWYPPLCAGFDLVVGIGLLLILLRRQRDANSQGVLTE